MATNAQKELAAQITKDLLIGFAGKLASDTLKKSGDLTTTISNSFASVYEVVLEKICKE